MKLLTIFAAMYAGTVFASVANATTLAHLELPELTKAAELIVYGRCADRESRWENGAVWTFVDFQVIESFKGAAAPAEKIRVRTAGGQVGHLQTRIEGVPQFFAGEEVVLFLERTSAGDVGVTGWSQGTFRVLHGQRGGLTVTQESSEFATFNRSTRTFSHPGIRNMDMAAFREKVRALAGK
ncbi:MAG TPA: hypothetical protein VFO34_13770 [Candidatus Acidoferrales bacterium]|nr:hypothetical protein [Candidatus Acidoferrales bacterium]